MFCLIITVWFLSCHSNHHRQQELIPLPLYSHLPTARCTDSDTLKNLQSERKKGGKNLFFVLQIFSHPKMNAHRFKWDHRLENHVYGGFPGAVSDIKVYCPTIIGRRLANAITNHDPVTLTHSGKNALEWTIIKYPAQCNKSRADVTRNRRKKIGEKRKKAPSFCIQQQQQKLYIIKWQNRHIPKGNSSTYNATINTM